MRHDGSVTVRAPAKVNLALSVGPPRADGYHELLTVFQALALYDDVTASRTAADEKITVTVSGAQADLVPTDETNLAVRAARLLAERTGVSDGVALHIHKDIPVAGGMAGGSADAAATLLACETLWQTGLTKEELLELAGELGSDVPFALLGGTAVGSGRGEVLMPALARGDYHWVLALPEGTLSTPAVYREIDAIRGVDVPAPHIGEDLMQALRSGDAAALGAALHNDLQPAAVRLAPYLARILDLGRECDALGGVVSGSGPTVAFLVADRDAALDLSVALTAAGLARDVRRVSAPAHGARLIDPHHPSVLRSDR